MKYIREYIRIFNFLYATIICYLYANDNLKPMLLGLYSYTAMNGLAE